LENVNYVVIKSNSKRFKYCQGWI